MIRWEYCVHSVGAKRVLDGYLWKEWLNEMGHRGWELVELHSTTATLFCATFKRRKE